MAGKTGDPDPELGLVHETGEAPATADHVTEKGPTAAAGEAEHRQDKTGKSDLQIFQELVGITSSPRICPELPDNYAHTSTQGASPTQFSMTSRVGVHRPRRHWFSLVIPDVGTNHGYYRRALDEGYKAAFGYHFSNYLISTLIIAQIILAAAITALGLSDNHKVTITSLGATNTSLAGLLAFAKGLGLPNRLLKARDQFNKIKEFIDYRERQFEFSDANPGAFHPPLNPYKEAEVVKQMFDMAKKDKESNYPDCYVNNDEMMNWMVKTGRAEMKDQHLTRPTGFSGIDPVPKRGLHYKSETTP